MLYLTLRQYEYITKIAETGSLSAAADVLHVTQPSLSTALSAVEDRIGVTLFLRRKGAPLVITPEGRKIVVAAGQVLEMAHQLERHGGSGQARSLTLGVFEEVAPMYLVPCLKAIETACPDLTAQPEIGRFDDLLDKLESGRLDLCLTYDLGLANTVHRTPIANIELHAFLHAEHPLAEEASLKLEDVAEHPLILSDEGLSAQHMHTLFRARGLTPNIQQRTKSTETLRSLAAHGYGIGLSYSASRSGVSSDGTRLAHVPISTAGTSEPLVLARIGQPVPESDPTRVTEALTHAFET